MSTITPEHNPFRAAAAEKPAALPPGFVIQGDRIGFMKRGVFVPVCGLLSCSPRRWSDGRDARGFFCFPPGWGRDVTFADADNNIKTWWVENGLLAGGGSRLFSYLGRAGLWLAIEPAARRKFRELLNTYGEGR